MDVKLISKVVNSKKDSKTYVNYYLVTDNGVYIAIKPSFNNDYGKLRMVATREETKQDK